MPVLPAKRVWEDLREQLLALDWMDRHSMVRRLTFNNKSRTQMIGECFAPDELLEGALTGAQPPMVLIFDADGNHHEHVKLKRQPNLFESFVPRPRLP